MSSVSLLVKINLFLRRPGAVDILAGLIGGSS